jgi:hypothetical protein
MDAALPTPAPQLRDADRADETKPPPVWLVWPGFHEVFQVVSAECDCGDAEAVGESRGKGGFL